MSPSKKPSLGLVALLLVVATLTGCVGIGTPDAPDAETTASPMTGQFPTTEGTEATDTGTVVTSVLAPSNASARERAIDAEETRVENVLANASNVSGTAGAYGRIESTLLGREEGVVSVRVVMSYSYEYACASRSGAVDGKTTEVVYRVKDDSVRLNEVVRDVRLLC
jgi:hypothetical protein